MKKTATTGLALMTLIGAEAQAQEIPLEANVNASTSLARTPLVPRGFSKGVNYAWKKGVGATLKIEGIGEFEATYDSQETLDDPEPGKKQYKIIESAAGLSFSRDFGPLEAKLQWLGIDAKELRFEEISGQMAFDLPGNPTLFFAHDYRDGNGDYLEASVEQEFGDLTMGVAAIGNFGYFVPWEGFAGFRFDGSYGVVDWDGLTVDLGATGYLSSGAGNQEDLFSVGAKIKYEKKLFD